MMNETNIKNAQALWMRASKELNFEFVSPFLLIINGIEKPVFGFLPKYGSIKGTILCLNSKPNFEIDKEIVEYAQNQGVHWCYLNIEHCLSFDLDYYKSMLDDLEYFG
jgi:hypothetical protein